MISLFNHGVPEDFGANRFPTFFYIAIEYYVLILQWMLYSQYIIGCAIAEKVSVKVTVPTDVPRTPTLTDVAGGDGVGAGGKLQPL